MGSNADVMVAISGWAQCTNSASHRLLLFLVPVIFGIRWFCGRSIGFGSRAIGLFGLTWSEGFGRLSSCGFFHLAGSRGALTWRVRLFHDGSFFRTRWKGDHQGDATTQYNSFHLIKYSAKVISRQQQLWCHVILPAFVQYWQPKIDLRVVAMRQTLSMCHGFYEKIPLA